MALIDAYAPLAMHGTTGATAATRYVGGTTSGAPASGTWAVGDYVVAQNGHIFVCTVAGTPGTWTDVGGGGGITQLTGDVTAGPGSGSQAATLATSGVTASTYGDSTHVAQVTFDAKGRATSATSVAISGSGVAPSGATSLIYRYTVVGSDKASIDTGVDSPDAGSADWTNGDVLEVFLYARTDEALQISRIDMVLNNDTSSIYDEERAGAQSASAFGASSAAGAHWFFDMTGDSAASGIFGSLSLSMPNFTGTVANKTATALANNPTDSAASQLSVSFGLGYRSTTAITRIKVIPDTAGKKLKIGSQLLIYKRSS